VLTNPVQTVQCTAIPIQDLSLCQFLLYTL